MQVTGCRVLAEAGIAGKANAKKDYLCRETKQCPEDTG
jgi:hypothetical protein